MMPSDCNQTIFKGAGDPARTRIFIEIIGLSVPTLAGAARFASIGYAGKFQLGGIGK